MNSEYYIICLDIKIHNADVNMLRNKNYNVIVARAFKPLLVLLNIIKYHFLRLYFPLYFPLNYY